MRREPNEEKTWLARDNGDMEPWECNPTIETRRVVAGWRPSGAAKVQDTSTDPAARGYFISTRDYLLV